ncbi:hypothetical protein Poly51_18190 [Rubripirellula tenax]|uniref:DUF2752 domain-containing protein n=1 Tax=Rubripirellula tenax TaxID=2528015 RepID=A0A5C6FFP1_9BACT|nr:DUF2752 domain-containing protein [Rubripirellula tenax]TWU59034.1 hypothetical protein Poly51_18190 [Rubripirellula tenax]
MLENGEVQPAFRSATAPISGWPLRLMMGLVAIVPLTLIGVAANLTPDVDGLGTHQQLGLPPCTMRVVFGIRCPACGMTTAWSHFGRGQWPSGFSSNIAGFLLAALAVAFAPIAVRAAWTGRMPDRKIQNLATLALVMIGAIATAQWLVLVTLK